MKRLLCILSGMNAGGAETFLMKVYRAINRTAYQMDFCINVKEPCFYEEEILRLGGKIFRIPTKSENVKEFKKQLSGIVSQNGYRYVLRVTSNAAGFMDLKIAKKAGAAVCAARSSNSGDGGGLRLFIAHRLGRALYGRFVDVKLAPSDLAAAYTFGKRAVKNAEVRLLRNALDLDAFRYDEAARIRLRGEFGVGENTVLAGHVGRFAPQKNHAFLFTVFAEMHRKNPDTVLLLVGDGEQGAALHDKARALGFADAVRFAGIRADIPQLLSAMDVLVFPSLYEGMPNVVVEAQATGLPCLVADTVTAEAKITERVEFIRLDEPTRVWAERALALARNPENDRRKATAEMAARGYDIHDCVKVFAENVFEREFEV